MARVVLATILALATIGSARGDASPLPPPRQSLVVRTGAAPCGAAVRAGSLWVGVYGSGRLLRLDAESGRIESSVHVGSSACRVAVGPASVWVTRDRADELVRVSIGTGRMRRVRVAPTPFDVLLASGSLWTTSYATGRISRIAPRTGRTIRTFEDGANPAGLTACAGRIWVGHGRTATWLTAIEPATGAVVRIDVGAPTASWPRCVDGDLWVTAREIVVQVDPRTGTVLARLTVGGTPAEAAAGPDGLVWITDKERSLVHRVRAHPATVVDSFAAGPGAFALARAGGSMWVTSFAGADVRRFNP